MLEQGRRDHDHARRAVAALEGIVVEERLLDRVQALGGRRPSRASSPAGRRRPRRAAGRDRTGSPSTSTVQDCRSRPVGSLPWWPWRRAGSAARTGASSCGATMTSTSRSPSWKRDDRRGHASDPPARRPGQPLERTADEHADHPPSIPVGGDGVRERARTRLGWRPRPPRRCRPVRGSTRQRRLGLASAERVRPGRAQRDPGVGHAVAVADDADRDGHDGRRVRVLAPELDEGRPVRPGSATSIAVTSSSSASRVVMNPVKKSASGTSARPAGSASVTAHRAPAARPRRRRRAAA